MGKGCGVIDDYKQLSRCRLTYVVMFVWYYCIDFWLCGQGRNYIGAVGYVSHPCLGKVKKKIKNSIYFNCSLMMHM